MERLRGFFGKGQWEAGGCIPMSSQHHQEMGPQPVLLVLGGCLPHLVRIPTASQADANWLFPSIFLCLCRDQD